MAAQTRARILEAGERLMRRQGYAATGVKQIVREADAPFSSLYHFYPGGKDELAAEAIRHSGAGFQQLVEAVLDGAATMEQAIVDCFAGAADAVRESGYEDACPIATVALEVASTNETLREATAEVFTSWIETGVARFRAAGVSDERARELSLAFISSLEGAFVLSRALRSTEPLIAAGAGVLAAYRAAQTEPQ